MPATASEVAARTRQLPWVVGLVAALLPPLLYGAALHARLASEAARTCEALAASFARDAVAEPALWRYAAPKQLARFVRDSGAPIAHATVTPCAGPALATLTPDPTRGPLVWRPVVLTQTPVAWVGVAARAGPGHRRLGWLAVVSALAALLLATWLHRRPLAALRAAAAHQQSLLSALDAAHATLTESNAALADRVAQARAENRELVARVVAVQESERKRIALDLHDEVGQQLTALRLTLDSAASGAASPALEAATVRCEATLEALRRAVYDLRPLELDQRTLGQALRALADRVERSSGLPVALGLHGRDLPASASSTALLRLSQEALNNAVRHANAHELALRLRVDDDTVSLTVLDDGDGASPEALARGGGVAGMRERARFLGGSVDFLQAPGGGTQVQVSVPASVFASTDPTAPSTPEAAADD